MKKVVMGLSGGMDSATLLGYYLNEGAEVCCCSFYYGSKHNMYELAAKKKIIDFYQNHGFGIRSYDFDLRYIFQHFESNLLTQGGKIPEGNYDDENMKLTVVPGRNTIFASIMLGLAQSIGARTVALGVHAGDHAIYPDCRQQYILELNRLFYFASENKVNVEAPFINEDKTSILKIGYLLAPSVPYHLTRTCYKEQELACGACGSCNERLEAYKNIGKPDPIFYETK